MTSDTNSSTAPAFSETVQNVEEACKESSDYLQSLCALYSFTESFALKMFLVDVLKTSKIHDTYKFEVLNCLHSFPESTEDVVLDACLYAWGHLDLSINLLASILAWIFHIAEEIGTALLEEYLDDIEVECRQRYNMVYLTSEEPLLCRHGMLHFMRSAYTFGEVFEYRYKILAAQFLLSRRSNEPDAMAFLMDVLDDVNVPIDTRADCADVIEAMGDTDQAAHAIAVRETLGIDRPARTIYEDPQNVHNTTLINSFKGIVCKLFDKYGRIDADEAYSRIEEAASNTAAKAKISRSLERIYLDQQTFTDHELKLNNVLALVWKHASAYPEVKDNLLVELEQADGKCSSGYFTRLANCLHGVDGFSATMSYQDEIEGCVFGRINARVRASPLCNTLLVQMSGDHTRKEWNEFLVKAIPEMQQELYDEYKDILLPDEFDTYFYNALVKFQ